MLYLNIVLTCIIWFFIIYAFLYQKKRSFSMKFIRVIESKRFEIIFIIGLIIICTILRLFELSILPAGINQDEASIAYDSWAIANYGIDRNGYHNPVYPVAWGAGHGPFYMYLAIIFIKLFGNSLFVYRLPQALLSILSVFVFYLLLKKTTNQHTAYIGALLLTISPWHIMASRWGLDANPAPLLILFGIYYFIKACDNKKTINYVLSSILLALSLYTYASTYIVIPILLLIIIIIALKRKYLSIKQLLISGLSFILTATPIASFWVINFFKLNEINNQFFSIPRLVSLRSSTVFLPLDHNIIINIIKNIYNLIVLLFSYPVNEIYNVINGFNIIYVFTFPLLILGIILSFKKALKDKKDTINFVMCAWFISSVIFSLLIYQNINRINVLFIPIIYFIVIGIKYLTDYNKELSIITISLIIIVFGLFAKTYFGTDYRRLIGKEFMNGFEEAVKYADKLDINTLYCLDLDPDERIFGAYMKLMYYLEIDPNEFRKTVEYYNNTSEFRYAKKFSKYSFEIPEDLTSDTYINDAFILPLSYKEKFDNRYIIKQFDNFIVVKRKSA